MGSLLVSPPASDTDARREFSTDEKAALLGRLLQTREALQLRRSSVWHTGKQTIAVEPCMLTTDTLQAPLLDYYSLIPSAVRRRRFGH